jgi:hypothetical protein
LGRERELAACDLGEAGDFEHGTENGNGTGLGKKGAKANRVGIYEGDHGCLWILLSDLLNEGDDCLEIIRRGLDGHERFGRFGEVSLTAREASSFDDGRPFMPKFPAQGGREVTCFFTND